MAKRKKRLEKQIAGLEKQSKIHQEKIESDAGRLLTTPEYWKKEKEGFDEQIKEKLEKLARMKKKKT